MSLIIKFTLFILDFITLYPYPNNEFKTGRTRDKRKGPKIGKSIFHEARAGKAKFI
ncbi:hypothetical protein GCM10007096_34790 [Pullulanibacillus pueri]|uniref:Uncharacterized protein n=1 Tax=Pullulanibacillus pueri TaxID=1437324 RepID=A0A8J2ZYV3_9BACL|nr:hypothetical protein GCM10007096_34790 [Pullulanibacillus pueri]